MEQNPERTRAEASVREYGYLQRILPQPCNMITESVIQSAMCMADRHGATAIPRLCESRNDFLPGMPSSASLPKRHFSRGVFGGFSCGR
jgi:hypothetical protein